MKKFFAMVAVALIAAMNVNVNAQSNSELKNEVSVTYGAGYMSAIIDAFGAGLGDAIVDYATDRDWANDSYSGTFGVEYFRHLNNPKLAVGGIATYTHYGEDVINKNENDKVVGERSRNYFTVMPAIKYNWVNKEHFAFYSKAAAGVMVLFDEDTDKENSKYSNSDTFTTFTFQVSPVGVEFGGTVRGFVELGFGEQGIALAGLKYKF